MPGNVLYSAGAALYTKNLPSNSNSRRLIGQINPLSLSYQEGNVTTAEFFDMTTFVQISKSQVLVSDTGNHVLRLIDRTTLETSLLAGFPDNQSFLNGLIRIYSPQNGTFSSSKFVSVHSMAVLNNVTVLAVDAGAETICVLDFSTEEGKVTHFFRIRLFEIIIRPQTGSAYVASLSQILKLNTSDYSLTSVVGNEFPGDLDGTKERAGFNLQNGIQFLNEETLLSYAWLDSTFRVVDINGNVSSICFSRPSSSLPKYIEGNMTHCSLISPACAMVLNSTTVLVGAEGVLMKLTSRLL